jgi:hypothetical protein
VHLVAAILAIVLVTGSGRTAQPKPSVPPTATVATTPLFAGAVGFLAHDRRADKVVNLVLIATGRPLARRFRAVYAHT